MIEALAVLIFLSVTFAWREVSKLEMVQEKLHALRCLTPSVQWYSLLLLGLGCLLAKSFADVVRFEFWRFRFLETTDLEEESTSILAHMGEEDRRRLLEQLDIPVALRVLSMAAPAAGLLAGCVVTQHIYALVQASVRRSKGRALPLTWQISEEMNMVLLVVAMPMVFIVMAMRAEIRILAVMTGSAWMNPALHPKGWDEVARSEMASSVVNLEVAKFFQYFTVWNFGRLCVHYLQNAPLQYRHALRFAGLQGVYLYVIFGGLRSIYVAVQTIPDLYPMSSESGEMPSLVSLKRFIGPVFTVATLLCVYNMWIIDRMNDVQEGLGSAGAKFNATRVLLLLSQIQPQVIGFLVVVVDAAGQPTAPALAYPALSPLASLARSLNLSDYRAQLLHTALLNLECLLAALLNRFVWTASYDYERGASGVELQLLATEDPKEVL